MVTLGVLPIAGIAIRSIRHVRADSRHAPTSPKRLFRNEKEGKRPPFNEAAHEPYEPITLRSLPADRSLRRDGIAILGAKGTASSARSPAKPRTERAPHFIKSLRSGRMSESVAQLRGSVAVTFSNVGGRSETPLCQLATPAGPMELIRSLLLHRLRPSPHNGWVSSCINSFVACSAFTHVTTYRLAKSPYATL